MLENYLIVRKSVLPDYFDPVLAVRRRLESGQLRDVSQACREAGISRSTYYKYKDCIFEPSETEGGRRAVLSMLLEHEPGVLSALLQRISAAGASVLTIDQSLPIHAKASLTVALDLGGMNISLQQLLDGIGAVPGVDNIRLIAIE